MPGRTGSTASNGATSPGGSDHLSYKEGEMAQREDYYAASPFLRAQIRPPTITTAISNGNGGNRLRRPFGWAAPVCGSFTTPMLCQYQLLLPRQRPAAGFSASSARGFSPPFASPGALVGYTASVSGHSLTVPPQQLAMSFEKSRGRRGSLNFERSARAFDESAAPKAVSLIYAPPLL